MARINVEEEAWARLYRLAEIMGVSVREALGTVGCLWRNSQDLIKTHGSRSEVIEWASLFKISDEEVDNWIFGLEKARFISLEENGLFKIHGNDIQLESRISKTNRAAKGGKALKKKLADLKRLQAGSKQASSTLQAGSKGLNAMQFNAVQGNAIQGNSAQDNAKQDSLSQSSKELNRQIWESYRDAYHHRYKHDPVRNAKVNSAISQLAKRLGAEAIEVVKFFVAHNDGYYLKKIHDITACVKDAEALRTQWARNLPITTHQVRNFEKNLGLVELMRDADKGGF